MSLDYRRPRRFDIATFVVAMVGLMLGLTLVAWTAVSAMNGAPAEPAHRCWAGPGEPIVACDIDPRLYPPCEMRPTVCASFDATLDAWHLKTPTAKRK